MTNDKKELEDLEALKLLDMASKQYEEYLRIAEAARLVPEAEPVSPAKEDWTHPMGLVLASSH